MTVAPRPRLSVSLALLLVLPVAVGGQGPHRVTVPVVVMDDGGRFVADLVDDDFAVQAAGQGTRVERVMPPADPISILFVIDLSGSVSSVNNGLFGWPYGRPYDAGRLARLLDDRVYRRLRPGDRVRVGTFGRQLHLTPSFVSDRRTLANATSSVVEPDPDEAASGSPIWDVVAEAVELISQEPPPRAIVLMTDGESIRSQRTVDDAAELALRHGVAVHVISLAFDRLLPQSTETAALVQPNARLRVLAAATGGLFLHQGDARPYIDAPFSRLSEMRRARWTDPGDALERALEAVQSTYLLTVAVDPALTPERLEISVGRSGATVHAPMAYVAP